MEDKFDQLKKNWNEAKKGHTPKKDSSAMLGIVTEKHNKSRQFHIGNILVLSMVVVGLCAFFYYLAPLQDTLSRIGIGLMIGGLLVRIAIEYISHRKASRIDYAASSQKSLKQAQDFYAYRQQIHGPVTITIIALYTIGFYALTPEFARYFSTFWMWMMDGSYLVIGVILFFSIRTGVVKEMKDLKKIIELEQSMQEG